MAQALVTGLVPGLLRPSVIWELYNAQYSGFGTEEKIKAYCEATQRLYDQGCVYSARLPLFLARRTLYAKVENDSFGREGRMAWLCKIAQLRSKLSPTSFPLELTEADNLAKQIPDRDKERLHFLWSGICCEMGKAYGAAGDTPRARASLGSAHKYAVLERPSEAVDALLEIAKAEKQIDKEAAQVTLASALKIVPFMMTGYAQVSRFVFISDLYFSSGNLEKAQEALNLAITASRDIAPHQEIETSNAKELIDGALCSRPLSS